MGILTGKYSYDNLPKGIRLWHYNQTYLKKIDPLINELREIGKNHGGKTPGQVSLNWLIVKRVVPIPGAKNTAQARENAGAIGWELTTKEIEKINNIYRNIKK